MNRAIRKISFILAASALLPGCIGGYPPEGPATVYDSSRPYALPYEAGYTSDLYQGFFGSLSHSGEFSLDFLMPIGTKVLAARAGEVVAVVESNTIACPLTKDCQANYIFVRHSDFSQARYVHIDTNGACVEVGDYVEQGDVIARSGHVGISAVPHLHFQIVSQDPGNLNPSDKPSFVDVNGGGTGYPIEKRSYTSTNTIKTNHCN